MDPEFYLVRKAENATEELEHSVFEAGFDDCSLTMRGGHAAIWIRHRKGELMQVVRAALGEAYAAGIKVLHVEIESAVLA